MVRFDVVDPASINNPVKMALCLVLSAQESIYSTIWKREALHHDPYLIRKVTAILMFMIAILLNEVNESFDVSSEYMMAA